MQAELRVRDEVHVGAAGAPPSALDRQQRPARRPTAAATPRPELLLCVTVWLENPAGQVQELELDRHDREKILMDLTQKFKTRS